MYYGADTCQVGLEGDLRLNQVSLNAVTPRELPMSTVTARMIGATRDPRYQRICVSRGRNLQFHRRPPTRQTTSTQVMFPYFQIMCLRTRRDFSVEYRSSVSLMSTRGKGFPRSSQLASISLIHTRSLIRGHHRCGCGRG